MDQKNLHIDTLPTIQVEERPIPMSASNDSIQSGVSTAGPVTPDSVNDSSFADNVRTSKSPVLLQESHLNDKRLDGSGPFMEEGGNTARRLSAHRLPSHQFGLPGASASTTSSSQSSITMMNSEKRPSYADDPYGTGLPPTSSINLGDDYRDVPFGARDHKFTPPGSLNHTPIGTAPPSFDEKRPLTMDGAEGTKKFTDSAAYWLILYFMFNLGLTLFNKVVLVNFPFPYTLTGLHALSGCAGCYIALERGAFVPARLTSKENLVMGAFSVLYTINIAVSNLSLHLVTVPFHQVVRASTPLFTILISVLFFRGKFSAMKLISLLPVIAGVGFATYGDYYFTAWGLILTLLGTFLAAFKTVITNVIQTGGGGRLKLHPLDLLMRMSPLAFIQCVIYGWWSGELERVRRYGAREMTREKAFALFINGMIAFGLNVVSFSANKKTGALTMTVAANCKQVLTIAIAVFLFNLHINFTNGIGIVLTLIGGGWYGWIEFQEKNAKSRLQQRLTKGP